MQWKILLIGGRNYAFPCNRISNLLLLGLLYDLQIIKMSRRTKIKAGNPRKSSRFICLNCLQSDLVTGEGIQRRHGQRNENHIKDLWCCRCRDTVKTLEVRYFDDYEEKLTEAKELRKEYYEMEENGCF